MLTRIDHVGIAVRDLDAAIAFYERAFGVRVVHEEVNEEQGVREAMLAVGDSGSCIQLLAPLREDSPIGKFLARSGEGIQQVAYGVDDVAAASDALRAAGLRVLYDEPRRGTAGRGSTSSTPRMPGACWSSWSRRPSQTTSATNLACWSSDTCQDTNRGDPFEAHRHGVEQRR